MSSDPNSLDLSAIMEELAAQEPIFHRPAFAASGADFDRLMAADYWEVGASGKTYTREFILEHLAENPPVDADAAGWRTSGFQCRLLSSDTFLLTYILDQGDRVTRRSTIWRRGPSGSQILYHQGTVVRPA